jgi:hypothetical protein
VSIDHDIDGLYQLPLAEFTAARNALATRAGARAAEIRRLPKPNAAAWAINQIYWRRQKTRDRVATASRRLRQAHAQQLAGKAADVAAAEAAHRAAIQAGVADARDLLKATGDPASSPTLQAVAETLQTMVWQDLDGRLGKPLKPTGLEALAALKGGGLGGRGAPAEIVAFRAPVPPAPESKAERTARETAERRRETTTVTRDLKAARTAESRASAALARAERLVDDAERERTQFIDKLERITSRLQGLRTDVDQRRKQLQQAAADRARLGERLVTLKRGS